MSPAFIYRPDLIHMSEEDIREMREAHAWFAEQLQKKDSSVPQLSYVPGTAGVVTSAGGEFLPEVVVCIKMLRRTGSTLAVEVWMESREEYEPYVCETVLPALNAKCLLLDEILFEDLAAGEEMRRNVTRYQIKAFALLASSFENVIWLDADQIPLVKPEDLFKAEPFPSNGLVVWPDYWCNTASPVFYAIADIPTPAPSERASSESGQILISKSKHAATLQLVAYYNFYCPSHYYRLLSQGTVGEGDKETFLAAAQALNAPFYAVAKPIETVGWHDKSGQFQGTGIVQTDPRDDYRIRVLENGAEKPARAFIHDGRHKPNAGRITGTY